MNLGSTLRIKMTSVFWKDVVEVEGCTRLLVVRLEGDAAGGRGPVDGRQLAAPRRAP